MKYLPQFNASWQNESARPNEELGLAQSIFAPLILTTFAYLS
jgi:hypothetical protein